MHVHAHSGPHCASEGTGRLLLWSFAATLIFVAVESVAGFRAGSLALISDAGHNFTDAIALLFSWLAFLSSIEAGK